MMKMFICFFMILSTQAQVKINGAGATFPYPIYSKWFFEYQKINNKVEFNYQSIGSGGGVKQIIAQTVDFGASDVPMNDKELQEAKRPILHIPTVIGAVVLGYHLKDLKAPLKLSNNILAKIFMGKIVKWNDAEIVKLNGAAMPNKDIVVVRRSDGSGTTGVFTEYLSLVSEDWKKSIGSGKSVNWPVGVGAKGNEGVSALIMQTEGAIGYTELAYAENLKISMAKIENKKAEYVAASIESIAKSALGVTAKDGDFRISLLNSNLAGAYPITSFSYLLLPMDKPNLELKAFIKWSLTAGLKFLSELKYAPLPSALAEEVNKKL